MAVYAIGDLHLPLGIEKPMDVFGAGWENYVQRIRENWLRTVSEDDIVVLCGDTSWATYTPQAEADFNFLHELPGHKLISKGNHDYWWTTLTKLNEFSARCGYHDMTFLHNTAYLYQNVAICASRGYTLDAASSAADKKIYARELIRLELSVQAARKLSPETVILALHYPPDAEFTKRIRKLGVDICVFGHLHGQAAKQYNVTGEQFHLVSSDFLQFCPKYICL